MNDQINQTLAYHQPTGLTIRKTTVERATAETEVRVTLNLDGSGQASLQTSVPFLDHLLNSLARHGRFDLEVTAKGDIEIDDHHTVEDIGIVLGQALSRALGDKRGIARFGSAHAPMDEALARAVGGALRHGAGRRVLAGLREQRGDYAASRSAAWQERASRAGGTLQVNRAGLAYSHKGNCAGRRSALNQGGAVGDYDCRLRRGQSAQHQSRLRVSWPGGRGS